MIKQLIANECEKKPKEEVCGFVVYRDSKFEVIPTINKSPEPDKEFYIPAKEFL